MQLRQRKDKRQIKKQRNRGKNEIRHPIADRQGTIQIEEMRERGRRNRGVGVTIEPRGADLKCEALSEEERHVGEGKAPDETARGRELYKMRRQEQ
ncbi:hypothetical protein RRG08_051313 [Elysia crispata]|uniref:Uncharacterized protein n=1 Tax=Elysia crispata TaxID=231223 RepID=A0AAE0ZID3_9GAST|nr:hypothetical protein RRG08_051313 [Elysia crispata]